MTRMRNSNLEIRIGGPSGLMQMQLKLLTLVGSWKSCNGGAPNAGRTDTIVRTIQVTGINIARHRAIKSCLVKPNWKIKFLNIEVIDHNTPSCWENWFCALGVPRLVSLRKDFVLAMSKYFTDKVCSPTWLNIDLVLFLRFENTQKENLANMDLSCPHARLIMYWKKACYMATFTRVLSLWLEIAVRYNILTLLNIFPLLFIM